MLNDLANLRLKQGFKPQNLAEAERLFRRVLAGNEEQLGATDPRTLNTVNSLAVVLR